MSIIGVDDKMETEILNNIFKTYRCSKEAHVQKLEDRVESKFEDLENLLEDRHYAQVATQERRSRSMENRISSMESKLDKIEMLLSKLYEMLDKSSK